MKLAIVIGHNAVAQGATRVTDGKSEFYWNSRLADLIRGHDEDAVRIFRRMPGLGYSAEIDRVYALVDGWGADCSVELHFNGVPDVRAKGCLTLTSGRPGSLALARAVHPRMLAVMGNEDDGIAVRLRPERGGRSLWQARAPAILTEPYFGSNASECRIADMHVDELAEAIFRGAVAFCAAR